MRTIQEVEPRIPITSLPTTIITPGSYYLTRNWTGITGYQGIDISSSGVTLDLNGFSLIGVAGSTHGIRCGVAVKQIVIRNGMIRGWGQRGIDCLYAPEVQVDNVVIDGNAAGGAWVGPRSTIRDTTTTSNTGMGLYADSGSTIDGCKAASNTQSGIVGAAGVTVSRSTALSNGASGIVLDQASIATDCTAQGNPTGFLLYSGSRVSRSTARQNGIGISASGYGASIEQCTAEYNTNDGIVAGYAAFVRGNVAHDNTNDGIQVTGSGSRIEDNDSIDNGSAGIRVDAGFNFVVKNRVYANGTGYSIAANNKVGTISIDPATAGPWANF